MAEIKTFTDEEAFWATVETLANWPERLVVSGGSAANFLDQVFVPDTAEIFLADERCVPADHADSNAGLIRKKLKEKNFVDRLDFYKPGLSAAACAAEYESKIQGRPSTETKVDLESSESSNLFDVVVLGVGPDGHTASLFPQQPTLQASNLAVTAEAPKEFAVKERLSLTFTALKKARTVLVLLQGREKQKIFETITNLKTKKEDYPARELLDWDNAHIFWLKK